MRDLKLLKCIEEPNLENDFDFIFKVWVYYTWWDKNIRGRKDREEIVKGSGGTWRFYPSGYEVNHKWWERLTRMKYNYRNLKRLEGLER